MPYDSLCFPGVCFKDCPYTLDFTNFHIFHFVSQLIGCGFVNLVNFLKEITPCFIDSLHGFYLYFFDF